jgi:hypothetical protein
VVSAAAGTLQRHPDFLVLIVFAAQPPAAGEREIQAVVCRVREHALELLRERIAAAFGDDPQSPVTDQLARFALAAIDGAFVAGRPTAAPRSSSCSSRSRPRSWRPAGPCWPEAEQAARCP